MASNARRTGAERLVRGLRPAANPQYVVVAVSTRVATGPPRRPPVVRDAFNYLPTDPIGPPNRARPPPSSPQRPRRPPDPPAGADRHDVDHHDHDGPGGQAPADRAPGPQGPPPTSATQVGGRTGAGPGRPVDSAGQDGVALAEDRAAAGPGDQAGPLHRGRAGRPRPEHGPDVVAWLLIYPDTYEIGLPNQGLQILYEILNERPDAVAERTYAPWVDMEAAHARRRRAALLGGEPPPGAGPSTSSPSTSRPSSSTPTCST